jgi:hypothetical protein
VLNVFVKTIAGFKMGCDKSKYRTAADAEYQIKVMQKRKGENYRPLRAYHCNECDTWHLTTKPDGQKFALVEELEKRCEMYKKQVADLTRAIEKRDQEIKGLKAKVADQVA